MGKKTVQQNEEVATEEVATEEVATEEVATEEVATEEEVVEDTRNIEFPRFVFTSPGPLDGGFRRTYGEHLVHNKREYDAALSAQWYATLKEAYDAIATGSGN